MINLIFGTVIFLYAAFKVTQFALKRTRKTHKEEKHMDTENLRSQEKNGKGGAVKTLKKVQRISRGTRLTALAVFVAAAAAWMSYYTVDEGERAVVLTFGEISKVTDPGLHFKVPLVQSVSRYSTRVQKTSFGDSENVLSAYSNDQQIIESYRISITWAYDATKIEDVYRHFGAERASSVFQNVVSPTVQQSTKAILGQYTAQTIIQQRARLDAEIEERLREQLKAYPIHIISIQFEDINFSATYEDVIEQTARTKMEVEKAENELKRIQVEAQQQVAQAEARNRAIKLQADAEAYQIETKAKAEAEAIRLRGQALSRNPALVELTIAEKWDGSVPETVVQSGDGQSIVPLMNIGKSAAETGAGRR